jgi:hypothetical protein
MGSPHFPFTKDFAPRLGKDVKADLIRQFCLIAIAPFRLIINGWQLLRMLAREAASRDAPWIP